MKKDWLFLHEWIQTVPMKSFIKLIPTGLLSMHKENHTKQEIFLSHVSTVPIIIEHIPSILTEIAKLYHPEGFTDNSWSGLGSDTICYCENCKKSFSEKTGKEIPKVRNWDDTAYREWIRWNYEPKTGDLGSEQPNNQISRRTGLHLVRNEQRLNQRTIKIFQGL